MPRIAVAVATIALIAFSIGLNTMRYTVVWDMVGGLPQNSQPGQPADPAAAAEPETIPQSPAAAQPTASATPAAVQPPPAPALAASEPHEEDAPCGGAPSGDVAMGVEAVGEQETTGQQAAIDSASPGTEDADRSINRSVGVAPAEASSPATSSRRLVPVIPVHTRQESPGRAEQAGQLRRLPPVDPVPPGTADRYALPAAMTSASAYPSTGA